MVFTKGLWTSFQSISSLKTKFRDVENSQNPHVQKHTILFVAAHPDDESVFGGGAIPYYAQGKCCRVVLVVLVSRKNNGQHPLKGVGKFTPGQAVKAALRILKGQTILRDCSRLGVFRDATCLLLSRDKSFVSRLQSLRNAIDIYCGGKLSNGRYNNFGHYVNGNITLIEGGFVDTGCGNPDPTSSWDESGEGFSWGSGRSIVEITPGIGNLLGCPDGRKAAALVVAKAIRQYKPSVVVSCHNLVGDYGHSDHSAAAISLIEGSELAENAEFDIESLAPWQAKKIYLRGSPADNRMEKSWRDFEPGDSVNGLFHDFLESTNKGSLSYRGIAQNGLSQHFTEGPFEVLTVYKQNKIFVEYFSEWWTLYRSNVGPDTVFTFKVNGDQTKTEYVNWGRGDFLENLG